MLRMVLCATLLVRRGAGVAMRTVASQAKRKNAPAQAQGVFETLNREARPTVRLLDLTEGAPVPYATCTDLQTRLVDECIDGARDALVLVEHPHVYTLGRGATHEHVLFDAEAPGAPELHRAERGGDVTYHGPGQLVAYPILNLHNYKRDSHWYLRALEEVVVRACDKVGASGAGRAPKHTGVWLAGHKVAAAGVAMRKWVTYHGISLNYAVEMERYQAIVPCGLDPVIEPVGSLDRHLGRAVDLRGELVPAVVEAFADVFECDLQRREPPEGVL